MPPRTGLRQLHPASKIQWRGSIHARRQLSSAPYTNLQLRPRNPRYPFTQSHLSLSGVSKGARSISIPSWLSFKIPEPFDKQHQPGTEPIPENATVISSPPPDTLPTKHVDTIPEAPLEATAQGVPTSLFELLPDTMPTNSIDITNIPERIGFMKELGLDYGWGPTSMIQFMIESIHVYTGLPWWGTVMAAAATIRLSLFYPYIRSSNQTAIMSAIKPVLDEQVQRMKQARNAGDQQAVQAVNEDMKEAKKISGLQMRWIYAPIIIQSVLGYCSFKLLRAMANLPIPGLETGGFSWMMDLTVPDPYFILPLAMAGMLHTVGRFGGEAGGNQSSEMLKPLMLYVIPLFAGGIMIFVPGIVQISFATASLFGVVQGYFLRQPWVREKLGLLPIIPKGTPLPELDASRKIAVARAEPRRGLRVTTPMPNYQAPTLETIVKAVEPPKDGDAKGGVSEWFASVKKAANEYVGINTDDEKPGMKSVVFKKKADAYEKLRKVNRRSSGG